MQSASFSIAKTIVVVAFSFVVPNCLNPFEYSLYYLIPSRATSACYLLIIYILQNLWINHCIEKKGRNRRIFHRKKLSLSWSFLEQPLHGKERQQKYFKLRWRRVGIVVHENRGRVRPTGWSPQYPLPWAVPRILHCENPHYCAGRKGHSAHSWWATPRLLNQHTHPLCGRIPPLPLPYTVSSQPYSLCLPPDGTEEVPDALREMTHNM